MDLVWEIINSFVTYLQKIYTVSLWTLTFSIVLVEVTFKTNQTLKCGPIVPEKATQQATKQP